MFEVEDESKKDGDQAHYRGRTPGHDPVLVEQHRQSDNDGGDAPSGNPLDSEQNQRLHERLLSFYRQELEIQYFNRCQQAIDDDYYDHEQWDEDDAEQLRERSQAPLVYNVIQQSINWVIGSEKRGRVDHKVLPREEDDIKPAETKTKLMKYISDVNKATFHRSRSFEDAAKVGIGWLEDGVQDGDDGEEPIYSRYESWRNMLWDSASSEMDLSDARYVSRTRWVDLDIAVMAFPDRQDILERAAAEADNYGSAGIGRDADEVMDSQEWSRDEGREVTEPAYHRQRVRLVEMWYRRPARVTKIVAVGEGLDDLLGLEYDETKHKDYEAEGMIIIEQKMALKMHVAIFTDTGLLYNELSPYRHNRFPFTPIWCYRRARDNMPYGMIRGMRDIQDDINKRASKALFIMSSNKVYYELGAFGQQDMDDVKENIANPNGMIGYRRGYRVTPDADRGMEQSHLDLMFRDIGMIQQVSGVTDELMGRETNAQSGRAVEARQKQGMMSTAKLFDNLRLATQIQGEIQLSLIEQYYTDQKVFRITNERGNPSWQAVNDGLPENDITRRQADFIISEDEWRATMRQAATDQLMEQMTRMPPEVAIAILDLLVESMDIPNREEIVNRIRQINGQRDPDATELTPEEEARAQQQQEAQQLQMQMVVAELRKKLAEAGKTEAEATKIAAELAEIGVSTQSDAIEAAQAALKQPGAARLADRILREAGYVGTAERQAMATAPQPVPPAPPGQQAPAGPEQVGMQPAQGGLPQ